MLNTIAVGTDGTPTASNAGAAAIDLAERNGARLVLISSYRNDRNDRLTSKQADAPLEIQWALNPRRRGRDDPHARGRRSGGSRPAGDEARPLRRPCRGAVRARRRAAGRPCSWSASRACTAAC